MSRKNCATASFGQTNRRLAASPRPAFDTRANKQEYCFPQPRLRVSSAKAARAPSLQPRRRPRRINHVRQPLRVATDAARPSRHRQAGSLRNVFWASGVAIAIKPVPKVVADRVEVMGLFEKTLPEIWKRLSFVRISLDHCRAGFRKYHYGAWSIGIVQRHCCAHLSRCRNERRKQIAEGPLTLLEKPTRYIGSGLPVG